MEQGIKYFAAVCLVVIAVVIFVQSRTAKPDTYTAELWHKDPNNWKMGGLFYYNRADPRIFPPKKMKSMGWTVNFGNPVSVVAFLVLLAALLYFLPKRL